MPLPLSGFMMPRAAVAVAPVQPLPSEEHHVSDSSEEDGAQELPPEDDHFYDTQEYTDMESEFRKFYSVLDDLPGVEDGIDTLGELVVSLRALATELEGLREEGWEMNAEESLADGGSEFSIINPHQEREQWRLRRQRRRAALEEERQRQQGATRLVSTTAVEGGAPVGMETDESDVQAAATQAAAAVAGVAAQAATGLKSPQRCSVAYALF